MNMKKLTFKELEIGSMFQTADYRYGEIVSISKVKQKISDTQSEENDSPFNLCIEYLHDLVIKL